MLALARFFSPPLMRVGRIREARQADLARRGSVLQRNVQRKRPDLRNVPPFEQQLHDRSTVHRHAGRPTIRCSWRNSTRCLKQLELPALMRSHGLILENVDGLENPTVKFVMRGVPHTLGMQVSLTRDTTQVPTPAEMTGWSGDGAPGTGSLREFAIGAVTQHFTKRLDRVSGTDFKLPKEHQLDAMEAFQLSLGREKDFDLTKITFKPTIIDLNAGEDLFVNGDTDPDPATNGTCNFCHSNGGAIALTPSGCEPQLQHQRRRPAASRAHPGPALPERRRLWENSRRRQRHIRQRHVQYGTRGGGGRHRALLP